MVAGVSMLALHEGDEPRVAEFCRRCTDFFELVEGQPGGPATAAEILGPLPERVASGTKRVFGIERAGDLIGVAELLEGLPGPNDWYIGLLALLPELRRGGLGTDVWLGLRDWIEGREAAVVRLVVQKQNPPARTFWEKQGFTIEEETLVKVGRLESPAWTMSLRLAAAAQPADAGGRS